LWGCQRWIQGARPLSIGALGLDAREKNHIIAVPACWFRREARHLALARWFPRGAHQRVLALWPHVSLALASVGSATDDRPSKDKTGPGSTRRLAAAPPRHQAVAAARLSRADKGGDALPTDCTWMQAHHGTRGE
jgi:hypothetical protein